MTLLNGLMDAPLVTPSPVLTNLKGLYNGAVTAAGSVSSWTDLSGNGNHYTQGTSGNRPVCTANQLNGKSTILFTSANSNFLSGPSDVFGIPGGACTLFLITKRNTDSALMIPYNMGGANATEQAVFFGASAGVVQATSDALNAHILTIEGVDTTAYQIYILTFDGVSTATFQINNGIPQTFAGVAALDINAAYLGCRSGSQFFLDGGIAAMALYDAELNSAQINQNLAYYNHEWAIY